MKCIGDVVNFPDSSDSQNAKSATVQRNFFLFAYEDCARICTQIYPVPTGKGDAVAIRTY